MQTAQAQQPFTNGNKRQLSSFELITNWIDSAYKLDLSPTAIQIMTVLLRFYNPQKKYVFPHQSTIAERTNTSIATVKRCLSELIKARLIIKTRTQKGNVYGFTQKLFELSHGSNCTIPTAQFEPCMNRTNNRTNNRTTTAKTAEEVGQIREVVVSFDSLSLKRVPASILAKKTDKNGKPIRSHAAYWNSFTDEQKREYLKSEAEEAEKLKKREELKKQQEAEEIRKRAEAEEQRKQNEIWNSLPLEKKFTRNQAIKQVWCFRSFAKKTPQTLELIKLYNLDVASINAMTQEEINKLS